MIYGSRLRRPIINDDIILFWTFCFDKKDRREMMTSCLKSVYMHTWTDKVGNEMSVQEIMQYTGAVWHCRAHFCLLIHSKWRQHWKWNKIDAKKCRGDMIAWQEEDGIEELRAPTYAETREIKFFQKMKHLSVMQGRTELGGWMNCSKKMDALQKNATNVLSLNWNRLNWKDC